MALFHSMPTTASEGRCCFVSEKVEDSRCEGIAQGCLDGSWWVGFDSRQATSSVVPLTLFCLHLLTWFSPRY